MSSTAIITFIVIAGFVWGGFAFVATLAMRKESAKIRSEKQVDG